jgi:hypothetical protein
LAAHLDRRRQLTVVIVQNFILADAEPGRADSCVSRYRRLANMPPPTLVVTGIAIGHRKKLHGVTGLVTSL